MNRPPRRRTRKGVIMILFTLMLLFVILPAVGLAIDVGVLLAVKSKMQTASDGAALAAGRSLSRAIDFSSQHTAASQTAARFYHMNLENGWLGLQSQDPTVTFPPAAPRTMLIQVDAELQAPTYFLRVLGVEGTTLRTSSQASRRFVNLALVLDRSGSLATSGSCESMRAAAKAFTGSFVNGQDKLTLVTFGTTYRTDFALADDFLTAGTSVPTLIDGINCAGGTNAASGYMTGAQTLINECDAGALNVVLFFTDGQPTALHLPAIPMTGGSNPGCANTSARSGVVTFGGTTTTYGVVTPVEPNPPGAVASEDWEQALNTPSNAGCRWASHTYDISKDTNRLTGNGAANWFDAFGSAINGTYSLSMGGSSPNQYVNLSVSNIEAMAKNALISAAARTRSLSAANETNVVTFAIGLGNTTSPPDEDLLNRIANTTVSPDFDSTYEEGRMIYASSTDQMQSAFRQLASEVLRIAQ